MCALYQQYSNLSNAYQMYVWHSVQCLCYPIFTAVTTRYNIIRYVVCVRFTAVVLHVKLGLSLPTWILITFHLTSILADTRLNDVCRSLAPGSSVTESDKPALSRACHSKKRATHVKGFAKNYISVLCIWYIVGLICPRCGAYLIWVDVQTWSNMVYSIIRVTSQWVSWRLKSPVIGLLV